MTDTKATLAEEGLRMNDDQIKYMVDRFLGWRLPEPWNPDNGISYRRPNYAHASADHDWPTGTNLFDADQAEAMVRYMVEGISHHPTPPAAEASDLVEKVARAQCEAHGLDPDALLRDPTPSISSDPKIAFAKVHQWQLHIPMAIAAISTVRREAAAASPTDQQVKVLVQCSTALLNILAKGDGDPMGKEASVSAIRKFARLMKAFDQLRAALAPFTKATERGL